MRFLRGLCRVLFALTFIFSGVLKLLDPVGTGLIVHEYLSFMHLDFLDSGAIVLGIALATLEFLIGICVLSGLRLRIVAWVALILTAFFTILTFYLMRFNPISDCGCFGEAIHLTNTQTFIKNVVLLVLAILIFLGRKRATRVAPAPLEWVFIALFALVGVGSSLDELAQENQARFETTFIYTKDGHTEEFTLDNLPDDSWTYLDSKTVQLGGSTRMAQVDFTLDQMEGPVLAILIFLGRKRATRVAPAPLEWVFIALFALVGRSNGGAVYFNDGTIVAKWANSELPKVDLPAVLQEDPDVLILKHRIREQLYVSILIAGVLVLLVLMRVLCKLLIKKR